MTTMTVKGSAGTLGYDAGLLGGISRYMAALSDREYRRRGTTASARNGGFGALIMLDLDHFKTLNDSRGHAVGDQLGHALALVDDGLSPSHSSPVDRDGWGGKWLAGPVRGSASHFFTHNP